MFFHRQNAETTFVPNPEEVIGIMKTDDIAALKTKYIDWIFTRYPLNPAVVKNYEPMFEHYPKIAHLAAFYGALKIVYYIHDNHGELAIEDGMGRLPAHFAAAGGHVNILQFLFDMKISISNLDSRSKSIVHYAVQHEHLDVLKWACEKEIPLNQPSCVGMPIHIACKNGSLPIIEYLCSFNPPKIDVNATVLNMTPLMLALKSSCFEAIPILIEAGLDLNQGVTRGWSVLLFAVRSGKERMVKTLCKHGVEVNQSDQQGWRPMHVAAQGLMPTIIDDLVEQRAEAICQTTLGVTPFTLANNKILSNKRIPTLIAIVNGVKLQITRRIVQVFIENLNEK